MTVLQYAFMTWIVVVVAICIYVFCIIIANDYFGHSCTIVVKTFTQHFQSIRYFGHVLFPFRLKFNYEKNEQQSF